MISIKYDLHMHSGLSSCADDDMTPVTMVGLAALKGLDAVAVSDHNAIGNVAVAMLAGHAYGVCVVPAVELQTAEDIHILCLFGTFDGLRNFYENEVSPNLPKIKNNVSAFGNQLVYDEDDNVVATDERLLHIGAQIAVESVPSLCKKYGGVAVAAHIDRSENGMVEILGDVISEYDAIELSKHANDSYRQKYKDKIIITNSDAHWTDEIGKAQGVMQVDELSAQAIVKALTK